MAQAVHCIERALRVAAQRMSGMLDMPPHLVQVLLADTVVVGDADARAVELLLDHRVHAARHSPRQYLCRGNQPQPPPKYCWRGSTLCSGRLAELYAPG